MALDERLLEILVCPNCRGELDHLESESALVCRSECGYRYRIDDGIPVLLVDEAEKPDRPGEAIT
ncbi:MAG: Trm112 family protein [Actinomycetota bacterium]|nr:Trm112 family protein [Actinomycetota bacterium]